MHILDLIMYFVTYGFLWGLLDKISNGDFTEEIGSMIGLLIMVIYTIIYIILFYSIDYNWIDVSKYIISLKSNVTW